MPNDVSPTDIRRRHVTPTGATAARREQIQARLDAARAELTALAAAHRKEGDELRHLPPALAEAFLRHDVYRLLLPHDLGGAGLDPLDYLVFRLPGGFFCAALAAVVLGIARGAAEALQRLAVSKPAAPGRTSLRDQASAQYAVGKTYALAESGSLYLRDAIAEVWQAIGRGDEIDLQRKARPRRACVQAAESGVEAVDLCCRAAGGAALFESLPFERASRDVHAAMGQIVFQRSAMEDVGRVAFGLGPLSPTF
jgi:alkylation response protein AidB-like acyl-CoA dehydrogenase